MHVEMVGLSLLIMMIFLKNKKLRNHGFEENTVTDFGYVSRMDNLQAAILKFRLKN